MARKRLGPALLVLLFLPLWINLLAPTAVQAGIGAVESKVIEVLDRLGVSTSSGAVSQITLSSAGTSTTLISQSSYLYTLGEGFASRNASNTGYKPVYGAGFVDYGQSYLSQIKLGLSTGFNTPVIDVPANDTIRLKNAAGTGSATIQFGSGGPTITPSGSTTVVSGPLQASTFSSSGAMTISPGGGSVTVAGNLLTSTAGAKIYGFSQQVDALASGAPFNGRVGTNEGASAIVVISLPTAVTGLTYTFVVQDSDGFRIDAASGDTIQVAATVTAADGYVENTTIGSTLTLVAINATEWVATASHGTWTAGP